MDKLKSYQVLIQISWFKNYKKTESKSFYLKVYCFKFIIVEWVAIKTKYLVCKYFTIQKYKIINLYLKIQNCHPQNFIYLGFTTYSYLGLIQSTQKKNKSGKYILQRQFYNVSNSYDTFNAFDYFSFKIDCVYQKIKNKMYG